MIDFTKWDYKSATDYRNQFVEDLPARVEWLKAEIARLGGPAEAVEGDPGDLVSLWAWTAYLIRAEGNAVVVNQAGIPSWWDARVAHPSLSNGALWLIDGLARYVASLVLRRTPGADFEVYRVAPHFNDALQHRTVLANLPSGRSADPVTLVYLLAMRTLRGEDRASNDSALLNLFNALTTD